MSTDRNTSARDKSAGLPFHKGETIEAAKRRKRKLLAERIRETRAHVFHREQGICRCCRRRAAQSMHELVTAGAMGSRWKATTPENSVAVCGSGTTGCHGLLQQHRIAWEGNAEQQLTFTPQDERAAAWLAGDEKAA